VCITVLTGNRIGWTARCGLLPLLLPSCRKFVFRLSALMDSDLAWVNGKSGRKSAFQRSIISGAIYHLPFYAGCFAALQTRCALNRRSNLSLAMSGSCKPSGNELLAFAAKVYKRRKWDRRVWRTDTRKEVPTGCDLRPPA